MFIECFYLMFLFNVIYKAFVLSFYLMFLFKDFLF